MGYTHVIATAVALPMLVLPGKIFADPRSEYETYCTACHGFGIAGAPILGDVDNWKPRIEKGLDVLYENAINGYTGELGVMPKKGGFTNLSDDQVRAIVDYMVENSR